MRKPYPILPWLVVGCITCMALADQPAALTGNELHPSRPTATIPTAVVELRGDINDFSQKTFERRMKLAQASGAKTIIINLDTYGGVVRDALEISQYIKSLTDIHTIAFVNNKAYSAGAMIAAACNEIVMVPHGAIGDCAPIVAIPGVSLAPHERAKSESPIIADFENSARVNDYPPLVLRAMVQLDQVVHLIRNEDGQQQVVGPERYAELTKKGWSPVKEVWFGDRLRPLSDPINSASTLLTIDAPTALALKLAGGTSPNTGELIAQRGFNVVGVFESGAGDRVVGFLNHGLVRLLVMMIFFSSLWASFRAPGTGIPEVLTLCMLGMLVGVPILTGFAQWWEILAILLGLVLLAVELFVIPGFGFAGVSGIILILGGLLMTFIAPEPGSTPISLPKLDYTWESLQHGLLVIFGGLVASVMLGLWLRRYLPSLPYFSKLVLTGAVGTDETAMAGSLTNIDPMEQGPGIGTRGKATTDLKPGGSAEFIDPAGGAHMVAVVSDSGFVNRGSAIEVRERHGNRIVVRAVDTLAPAQNSKA